jgi:hypothetical protein
MGGNFRSLLPSPATIKVDILLMRKYRGTGLDFDTTEDNNFDTVEYL